MASLLRLNSATVYILLCANGQYYVGSTENLERRLKEHQNGTGCGFTKAHLPVKLVNKEEYTTIEEAYQRERQLHGWSRKKKEALISGDVDALQSASTGGS
jgi:putative endonuclease